MADIAVKGKMAVTDVEVGWCITDSSAVEPQVPSNLPYFMHNFASPYKAGCGAVDTNVVFVLGVTERADNKPVKDALISEQRLLGNGLAQEMIIGTGRRPWLICGGSFIQGKNSISDIWCCAYACEKSVELVQGISDGATCSRVRALDNVVAVIFRVAASRAFVEVRFVPSNEVVAYW